MSRRRKSKWPWIFSLLLAAGVGAWWWFDGRKADDAPLGFETATVSKGEVKKVVKASGVVNPITKVEVGSQISGTINKLHVDFNSKVKTGDILCQLDPATYEAALLQAEAERDSAKSERDYQEKTLGRKRELLEKKLFPQADYDRAEADLVSAEARLLLTAARMKKAKVDLDRCTILAPMDGMIIDRTAEVGMTIAASFNAPKLFILANDLTKMQINAQVSEAYIGQIKEKQRVVFKVDAYPEPFEGEVVQVRNSPISEENVVNYDAIIHVKNPDQKLKPGMTGEAEIITAERTAVLRAPNSALRFKPPSSTSSFGGGPPGTAPVAKLDEREVYLHPAKPADELKPRKVQVGVSDGIFTEIISGLTEGDAVITLLKPPSAAGPTPNPLSASPGRRR